MGSWMSTVCREIRSTAVPLLREDKRPQMDCLPKVASRITVFERLKTYLGARSSSLIRLFDPPLESMGSGGSGNLFSLYKRTGTDANYRRRRGQTNRLCNTGVSYPRWLPISKYYKYFGWIRIPLMYVNSFGLRFYLNNTSLWIFLYLNPED